MVKRINDTTDKAMPKLERFVKRYPKLTVVGAIMIIYFQFIALIKWVPRDNYDMVLPIYTDISLHLKNGCLPLWSFFWQRGVPLGNLIGPNVWDPATFVLGLIGYTSTVVQYQYAATAIIGALGFYFVSMKYCGDKTISVILAIVFASSGFMAGQNDNYCFVKAAALLPYWHLTLKNLFEEKNLFNSINFGVVFGLIIAINYPVLPVIFLLFTLVEIIVFYAKKPVDISLLKSLAISIFVAICVGCATIVSTIEIMSQISRSQPLSLENIYSFFPLHIMGALAPSFGRFAGENQIGNSGQIYIALPVLAFIIPHQWGKLDIKLTILFIFSLLMTMGQYSWLYQLFFYYVPGFEYMRFPNFIRIFAMFYALILAVRTLKGIYLLEAAALISVVRKRLLILSKTCLALVIAILLCALITWNTQTDYFRCCGEIAGQLIILFILTKYVIAKRRYNDAARSVVKCKRSFIVSIIFFAFIGAVISFGGTDESQNKNDSLIRNLYTQTQLNIENRFVTTDNSKNIYLEQLNSSGYLGGFELEQNVVAQKNGDYIKAGMPVVWHHKNKISSETAKVRNIVVSGNGISFFVNAIGDGTVMIEQNYFPHWLAKVDNNGTTVNENSNYTLNIELPAGEHFVELEYSPVLLKRSAYISIVSWGLLVTYYLRILFINKTKIVC
ncbi:MAG: hypothetical protein WCP79_09235 [Bacillota bacterium]